MTVPPAGVEYRQPRFAPPPGATVLLVVRHGESAPARPDAPFPLVHGRGDPELAPEGEDQAERVGARLAIRGVDAIYVTPLRRTAQTAAPLVARTGLKPVVVADLMEVGLGEWEGGLYRQRVADRHPLAVRMMTEERWDVIPGAEGLDHLRERIRRGVERIAADHADQRVAVFTHGGVIGTIMSMATGSRPFAFNHAENGSLSEVVVTADRWSVRSFNDTSHL
ncbi:MAG TPA: histidine phosphatase family protein [Pseudonocardiaceae bacterium]|nr:histidine phosphatase family protein [Pseudonocardiaceae bacterium]